MTNYSLTNTQRVRENTLPGQLANMITGIKARSTAGSTIILGGGGGGGGGTVTGTGTTNYLTKWTGATSIGNADGTDDGASVRFSVPVGMNNNNGVYWQDTGANLDRAGIVFNAANNLAISASKLATNTSLIQFLDNPGGNVAIEFNPINSASSQAFIRFPLGISQWMPAFRVENRADGSNDYFIMDLDPAAGIFWRYGLAQKQAGIWETQAGILILSGYQGVGTAIVDGFRGTPATPGPQIAVFGPSLIQLSKTTTITGNLTVSGTIFGTSNLVFQSPTNDDVVFNPGGNTVMIARGAGGGRVDMFKDMLPISDNVQNIGSNSYRFKLVRAVTVTQGDLGFEERVCANCHQPFKKGQQLILQVKEVHAENGTLTVPVHLKCPRKKKRKTR